MENEASYRMRKSEWERFANEDAYSYICTELSDGDAGSFWESGEDTVERELMPTVARYKVPRGTALEIGCGVGRLTLPMARHFESIFGVDLAVGMISQANSLAEERGVQNARFLIVDDPERLSAGIDSVRGKVDFVYSLLVLQHIDDFRLIEAYMRAVSGLLSRTGVAYLQFDTRPKTLFYYFKTGLPDFVLRRNWRRGLRRIRRSPKELELSFAKNKLKVLDSIEPSTELHRYILQPGQ
jgi:2-polyprenyl-3-methyl-5-hydroxy-6-metoxy-1,4-benzoquinol methylase